jgi:hypothetical protein
MVSLSRLPVTVALHRTAVALFRRAGRSSERLFGYYRRAWVRLARFQQTQTYFGSVVECDLRDRVPEFIFHFGHWEPNISYWISQRLRRGDVFVDVGSNLGYYSLLAAGIVGAEGKRTSARMSAPSTLRFHRKPAALRSIRDPTATPAQPRPYRSGATDSGKPKSQPCR